MYVHVCVSSVSFSFSVPLEQGRVICFWSHAVKGEHLGLKDDQLLKCFLPRYRMPPLFYRSTAMVPTTPSKGFMSASTELISPPAPLTHCGFTPLKDRDNRSLSILRSQRQQVLKYPEMATFIFTLPVKTLIHCKIPLLVL